VAEALFVLMARNAADPALWFGLPDDRTVVMGSSVRI
jgi:K+ transporter